MCIPQSPAHLSLWSLNMDTMNEPSHILILLFIISSLPELLKNVFYFITKVGHTTAITLWPSRSSWHIFANLSANVGDTGIMVILCNLMFSYLRCFTWLADLPCFVVDSLDLPESLMATVIDKIYIIPWTVNVIYHVCSKAECDRLLRHPSGDATHILP